MISETLDFYKLLAFRCYAILYVLKTYNYIYKINLQKQNYMHQKLAKFFHILNQNIDNITQKYLLTFGCIMIKYVQKAIPYILQLK